jgi:hypothetical protein
MEELRAVDRDRQIRLEREARQAGEEREVMTHESAAIHSPLGKSHSIDARLPADMHAKNRRAHSLGIADDFELGGMQLGGMQLLLGQGEADSRVEAMQRKRSAGQVGRVLLSMSMK